MKQNKSSYVKLVGLFLVSSVFGLTVKLHAQQTNFSGKWVLDTAKSTFGNAPLNAAVLSFDIKQENNSIDISRVTRNNAGEEMTTSETDLVDGKPRTIKINDALSKDVTLSWTEDKGLTTLSVYHPKEGEAYTLTQTWYLLDAGTLEIDLTSPSYKIKAIYNKQ